MVFDHVDATADVVPIPWRREAWSLMRVLFALHVYVHLAVYHGLARSASPEITSRFGEPPADAALSRATFGGARYATPELRARHLAEQLAQRSGLFTGYGHQLIAWLVKALDLLAPPTPGGGDGTTYQAVAPRRRRADARTAPPRRGPRRSATRALAQPGRVARLPPVRRPGQRGDHQGVRRVGRRRRPARRGTPPGRHGPAGARGRRPGRRPPPVRVTANGGLDGIRGGRRGGRHAYPNMSVRWPKRASNRAE
ncbi:hypothetical protein [Nonomuraea salmonea]|uniref:hypothetical protein n=1 Tax=Nonomuraea salmonea TaxID=46181 RepID=UPI0031ED3FFA